MIVFPKPLNYSFTEHNINYVNLLCYCCIHCMVCRTDALIQKSYRYVHSESMSSEGISFFFCKFTGIDILYSDCFFLSLFNFVYVFVLQSVFALVFHLTLTHLFLGILLLFAYVLISVRDR